MRWFVVVAALTLQSCASAPALRYDQTAEELGLRRELVDGQGFSHAVYSRTSSANSQTLHVYLDSDGTPWVRGVNVADDPTPTEPLTLRLMSRDPAAAVLVGRPCYHGLNREPACGSHLWTSGRYSEAVVTSIVAAIKRVRAERHASRIVLIGYSGGGALAMLVARSLADEVDAVVTIAANLDIDAWTRLHGYRPLVDSLNPATQPPLPRRIAQLHVAGGEDRNVPPQIIADFVARQPGAKLRVVQSADHACCWEKLWPQILAEIE